MNKQDLTQITKEQRKRIYIRDSYTCRGCGAIDNLTLDHILPKSEGGTNDDSNLQTLCAPCNRKKGNNLLLSPFKKIRHIWTLPDQFSMFKNLTNGLLNAKMLTVKTEVSNSVQQKLTSTRRTLWMRFLS